MLLPRSQEEAMLADSSSPSSNASTPSSSRSSLPSSRRSYDNNGKYRRSSIVFRSCSAVPEYLARVIDYRQMDLEATFYQMVALLTSPSKVYKSAYYRKQTKNRWARDDPAFSVIQVVFLLMATVSWAVTFKVNSFVTYTSLLFHAIVVEWLGAGLLISTFCWWFANTHLRKRASQERGDTFFVEQRVEWQFAFDIHCNAFFVLFLILYVLQFLLAPVASNSSFLSLVLSNLLYSFAWGIYTYITFLGYVALPFLQKAERFLLPMMAIAIFFVSTLLVHAVSSWDANLSRMSIRYYYP